MKMGLSIGHIEFRYGAAVRGTYMFGKVDPLKPNVAMRTTPVVEMNEFCLSDNHDIFNTDTIVIVLTFIVDNKLPKMSAIAIKLS